MTPWEEESLDRFRDKVQDEALQLAAGEHDEEKIAKIYLILTSTAIAILTAAHGFYVKDSPAADEVVDRCNNLITTAYFLVANLPQQHNGKITKYKG